MARPARPRPAVLPVPAATDWLRPAEAAALAGVSTRTLRRWADARWIGRSRVGGNLWYSRPDIEALIDGHATPRTVVRVVEVKSLAGGTVDRDWQDTGFWRTGGKR